MRGEIIYSADRGPAGGTQGAVVLVSVLGHSRNAKTPPPHGRVDDSYTSSRQMQAFSDSVQPTLTSLPHLWDADERCCPARGGDATNPRGFPQPPCKVPDLQRWV